MTAWVSCFLVILSKSHGQELSLNCSSQLCCLCIKIRQRTFQKYQSLGSTPRNSFKRSLSNVQTSLRIASKRQCAGPGEFTALVYSINFKNPFCISLAKLRNARGQQVETPSLYLCILWRQSQVQKCLCHKLLLILF